MSPRHKTMTTIVLAHPYVGSFNQAILDTVHRALDAAGKEYSTFDLYADDFNPAMSLADLALYSQGRSADPLVQAYIDTLLHTDEIVFIGPIWWGRMPAIIDGFFDKVMLVGTGYTYGPNGLIPDKFHISRSVVITTSEAPSECFENYFHNYFAGVLATVGMQNMEWHNCPATSHGPAEGREEFLRKVASLFA